MSEAAREPRWFDEAVVGRIGAKFLALFDPPELPYYFSDFAAGVRGGASALSPGRQLEFLGRPISSILLDLEHLVPQDLQRIRPQWTDDDLRGKRLSAYRSLLQQSNPDFGPGYGTLKGLLLGLLLVKHKADKTVAKYQIEQTSRFIRLASADVHYAYEHERRNVVASLPPTFVPSEVREALGSKGNVPEALHPRLDELLVASNALARAFSLLSTSPIAKSPVADAAGGPKRHPHRTNSISRPNTRATTRWTATEHLEGTSGQPRTTHLFGILQSTKNPVEIAKAAETADDYSAEADAAILELAATLSSVHRHEVSVRHRSDVRQGFWARTQWDALTPAEMRHAKRLLTGTDIFSNSSHPEWVIREAIALGLLCASSGSPSNRVHALQSTETATSHDGDALDLRLGALHLMLPGDQDRYQPSPEQGDLLQPATNRCVLTLPDEAFEAIQSLEPDADGFVFRSDLNLLESILEGIFAESRKDEPRITLARLCRGHQLGILATCQDVALAQIVCGQTLGTPTTPLAYYAAQPSKIQETFDQVVENHGFTPREAADATDLLPVGSRLILTAEANASMVKAACKGITNRPRTERTEGRMLLELHDCLVPALGALWMMATSFRPTFHIGDVRATMIDWWESLAVITDKVSDDGHEGRLVPLAPTLLDSLGAYGWLLEKISSERKLPRAIRKSAKMALDGSGPLFFLTTPGGVRPLAPADLDRTLPEGWNLPANFRRHRLATRLREVDCPGLYIQALMGHHELGIQPHGSESFQNPMDFVSTTRECIQRVLTEDGWKPLLGGAGSLDFFRNAVPAVGSRAAQFDDQYEKRARSRFRRDRQCVEDLRRTDGERIQEAVWEAIRRVRPQLLEAPEKKHIVEKETVSELRRSACADANGLAEVEIRVAELKAFLKNGKDSHGWIVRSLPHFFLNRPAPSVHVPEMVEFYRAMCSLRRVFLCHLAGTGRAVGGADADLNLVLALILWHGVCSWERLEAILDGLPSAEVVGRSGQGLAVPILIHRYESDPDPVASAEVLFGGVALAALRCRGRPAKRTREALSALVFSWLPNEIVRCTESRCLDVLFGLAKIAHRFDAPGPARHAWNGDYLAVGMPLDRLRALFGISSTEISRKPVARTSHDIEASPKLKPGDSARRFSWLVDVLKVACGKQAELPESPKHDTILAKVVEPDIAPFTSSKASPKRRAVATDMLELAMQAWPEDGSLIRALTAYALDRLKNGTPWNEEITAGTVYTYVRAAGSALLKHDPDYLLSNRDAEDLTESYEALIGAARWKDRRKLGAYLAYFHLFLADHGLAPPVAIGSYRTRRRSLPEMGYVAPSEVLACEGMLERQKSVQDSEIGTNAELQIAKVAMTISFAAGSRTGEIVFREARELVMEAGRRALLIRGNRLGRVKTFHSNRIVDLEPYLPDKSWSHIAEWHADSSALRKAEEQQTSALLSMDVDGHSPPAPNVVSRLVGSVLRSVTCRPDARMYWGRHTSSSNDVLALLAAPGLYEAIRNDLGDTAATWLPEPDRVRESLGGPLPLGQAHAAGFRSRRGHASMRTSCETYTHTWNLIEPWPCRNIGGRLTGDAMASLLGMAPAALRKRLSRAPIPKREPHAAMAYLLQQASGEDPNIRTANEGDMPRHKVSTSIEPIQLVEALQRALKRRDVDALAKGLHLTGASKDLLIQRLARLEVENGLGLNLGFDLPSNEAADDEDGLLASVKTGKPVSFARLKKPWILDCIKKLKRILT